jgi:uncharacterized membrane protein
MNQIREVGMATATKQSIRNPGEWTAESVSRASRWLGAVGRAVRGGEDVAPPKAQSLSLGDLRAALRGGWEDFLASRTDVIVLCVIYPLAGLAAVGLASDAALAPLLFPAISGFAIVGPALAVLMYETSRRRERGEGGGWSAVVGVLESPSFGAMTVLAVALFVLLGLWLSVAQGLYMAFLGPEPPVSVGAFLQAAATTPAGWAMSVIGMAVGALFAALAFAVSVVSFPLLLDRQVGAAAAVRASVDVVAANPMVMAVWAAILAGGLILGSVPLFLGLVVAMPVLGHATWRLYRRAIA